MNMPCSNTALLNDEEIRQVANEVKEAERDEFIASEKYWRLKAFKNDPTEFLDHLDQDQKTELLCMMIEEIEQDDYSDGALNIREVLRVMKYELANKLAEESYELER